MLQIVEGLLFCLKVVQFILILKQLKFCVNQECYTGTNKQLKLICQINAGKGKT